MTLSGVVSWVATDLRMHKSRTAVSVFGIAVGIAALVFFLALGAGVRSFAVGKAADDVDARLMEVVPKTMEIGFFKVHRPGLLGNTGLDAMTLDRLRRVEGITAVYPRRMLRVPATARGGAGLLGKDMLTDLFAEGIDPELLARDVKKEALVYQPGEPLPIIANDQLLALFNGSVAEAMNVPKLAKDAVTGFTFEIVLGQSFLMGSSGAKKTATVKARIVGFSPYAMKLGVSMPMPALDAIEKEFRAGDEAPTYTAAIVFVQDAAKAASVAAAIDKLGLKVSEANRRTADAIRLATLTLALIASLVLLVAAFNIGQTFVAQFIERRAELALLKALGASGLQVLLLMLVQAVLIGIFGGALGVLFGYGLSALADSSLQRWVSDIPFRPEHFFAFEPMLVPLGIAVATMAAVLGALIPAFRAMRDSPARVLSSVEN
ncbi:MAG: ABC transporter permease [Deltaproteobacteria bacterium]|nr:ABC transporter permease [Deltaproteobacteria bacterium]